MAVVFTEEQLRVIDFTGARLVLVAGPGAGKTQTIVERMTRLLKEDPKRIVSFLTFTRASRRDTDEKVRKAVGDAAAEGELPRVSTLHGFATSVVRKYAAALDRGSRFSILSSDTGEKELLLSELTSDLGLACSISQLNTSLTCYRATDAWPTDSTLTGSELIAALEAFERFLIFYNTFDFEGIAGAACQILSLTDVPPVFLQVDEYQDLNPIDQRFVELASGKAGSQVVVVGDDAQSIYGRRHANRTGLLELWNSGGWEHERLTRCHRLPAHLLRAAHALIEKRGYLGGAMTIPPDSGRRVLILQCSDAKVEVKAVAKEIRIRHANEKTADGMALSYKNFMVLCPSKHLDVMLRH